MQGLATGQNAESEPQWSSCPKQDTNITYGRLYGRGSETIPREGRENVRGRGFGGVMGNTAFWTSNGQFVS